MLLWLVCNRAKMIIHIPIPVVLTSKTKILASVVSNIKVDLFSFSIFILKEKTSEKMETTKSKQ